MRKRTFKEKKEITANKEKLEAEINDIAIEYFLLSKQDNDIMELKILRKQLLEYIFIYCKDFLFHLQSFIYKKEVTGDSSKERYFYFTEKILDLFNDRIRDFDLDVSNNFINFWNATLKKYFPEPLRKKLYYEDNFISPVSPSVKRKFNTIQKGSYILALNGKISSDYEAWTLVDIEAISKYCTCSVNYVEKYINYYHNLSNNLSLKKLESNYGRTEDIVNELEFNINIDKICSTFINEKEQRKPYISKLLTFHFITDIGVNDINYPFIDKEFAKKLDDVYKETEKYPTLEEFGKEYSDSNPGQTLKRFFEKVRR